MRATGVALGEAVSAVRGFLQFQSLMGELPLPLREGSDPKLGSVLAYEALRSQVLGCRRCNLAKHRTQIVFSGGNPRADLVLVGEAPGADEDAVGEPFVGRAGQLLDKMLRAISLTRKDVCLANVVKCRPPGNRNPSPQEIAACLPMLEQQLALLQPPIILALGRVAAQTLMDTDKPLSALRGRWHSRGSAQLIATYHPAALLRNDSLKRAAWKDMKTLRDRYERIVRT